MPINAVNSVNTPQIIEKQEPKIQTNNDIEQPTSNNNQKALIGVGAALALATLGVLGHKGYLGEGIQKALGGAAKAAKEEGTKKAEEITTPEVKKTFKDLYNDAIKEKKESIKNEVTGKTHSFEYAEDGTLIKETISKGDDYAIYKNISGKMRIVEAKKGETISLRHFNEDGTISRLKPEVPVKAMPRLIYDKKLPPEELTKEQLPKNIKITELPSEMIETCPSHEITFGEYIRPYNKSTIYKIEKDANGNIIQKTGYDLQGNLVGVYKYNKEGSQIQEIRYTPWGTSDKFTVKTLDENGETILEETFNLSDGKLISFKTICNDGQKRTFSGLGWITL